jgi:drug/metabolite transporter (DMT)-like permease
MKKEIKWALATALVSGVSIFINKYAVGAITPALTFTAVKNTGVGLLVISLLVIGGKWRKLKELKKSEWLKLGLIGIIGGSLPFYLFFEGLSRMPAINAALIHKTLVIWVAILGYFFLKEKLSRKQMLAIGILFASNLVVGGFQGFEFGIGMVLVLGATLLWAVESVIAKKVLAKVDTNIVVAARMGLGAIVLLTAALIQNPQSVMSVSISGEKMMWLGLTAISLFAYVSTWYKALKFGKVTTVATVLVASTLVTNLLSAIFITHNWTMAMGVQAAMIIGGVGLFVEGMKKVEEKKKVII